MSILRQRASRKGREFLAREEGLRPYAYADSAGNATFGIGHLLHPGPVTAADGHKWGTKQHPHTRAYAMRVFRRDLRKYEKAVRDAVGRRLPQQQFDACVSLCFNIGIGGFAGSTVAGTLRNDSPSVRARIAAQAFLLWSHPAELRPRRERERRLFLEGKYR
jgi:lysozyme